MKGARNQDNRQSKQGITQKPKPEIRDDLDSRKEREPQANEYSRDRGKKKRKS